MAGKIKRLKKINIDLSKATGYIPGEHDKKISEKLGSARLYDSNCLYSVFDSNLAGQVEKTGSYRMSNHNSIYAFTKDELKWESENPADTNNVKNICKSYADSGIAVYDKSKFTKDSEWNYSFNNPENKLEALIGIAFLKFE